jgi:hypothetical protein
MPTLTKLKNKSGTVWRVQVRITGQPTESGRFKTMTEAQAWGAQREAELRNFGGMTLGDAFERFSNELPRDRKGPSPANLSIRAYWPKRIPETMASLESVIEDPAILIPPNIKDLPTYFEIVRVVDMGARFKGAKTFVEDVSIQFPKFYHDAGQHLTKWFAQAPKIKESVPKEPSIPTIFSDETDAVPSTAHDVWVPNVEN